MNQIAPIDEANLGLARYDAACRAVAAAKSVDEVKEHLGEAEAMRAYAKQAKNKQLEIDAAEIRIRAERRIGELMSAQRQAGLLATGGDAMKARVETKPEVAQQKITLAEAGIDKNLADRARKYAAIPETEFEGILADRRDRYQQEDERVSVNLMAAGDKHVRGTFGTGENEWYTPNEHIEASRAVLGHFDLDPASSEVANRTVKANKIFTLADDGLAQEWHGRVWLNPPYAQPAIAHFADKMIAEYQAGRVEQAIMLTHNYTDTAWFQKLAQACDSICFTRGRVRFVSPTGELASPTQGQAFFYFGSNPEPFRRRFIEYGFVAQRAWELQMGEVA